MNILPSSFISTKIVAPIESIQTASSINNVTKTNILKCAVCENSLVDNQTVDEKLNYRLLAVRPSVGSKDPFFPVLEKLTHTSAIHVPCCLICSESLLDQWNKFEYNNVFIKNRIYKLPSKLQNRAALIVQSDTSKTVNDSRITATSRKMVVNSQVRINNSTASNPQDEVLDLSITGPSKSDTVVLSSNSNIVGVKPTSNSISNISANFVGARTKNSIPANDFSSISPYSSMSNLIKVSSSPANLLKTHSANNESQNDVSSAANSIAKRSSLICTLCEESSLSLYPILLRPMGNCPYFPSLMPHIKSNNIDSNGKINVCESCHHQLILQWDNHQKTNKPILERKYQITKTLKCSIDNGDSSHILLGQNTDHIIATPIASSNSLMNTNNRNNHVSPISQSFVSLVAANKTFTCEICNKDLILNASSDPTQSSQVAFSVSTGNETVGNVNTRKLIIQSAQEISLLPFLSTSTSLQMSQLQLLHENDRVLICSPCYETISSRSIISNNNESNNFQIQFLKPDQIIKGASFLPYNTKEAHSLNEGISAKVSSNALINLSNEDLSSNKLLCSACKQHKFQYLVETKENTSKKPFFPFLHNPNEANDKARLCAPCHLMLETQWDAYENSYVPYNQRVYRLSSTTGGQSFFTPKRLNVQSSTPSSNTSTPILNVDKSINGQSATSHPLKIQINVPNSSNLAILSTSSNNNLSPSKNLLLTTVNNHSQPQFDQSMISSVQIDRKNSQRIISLMNDFLINLGGPHPLLSGICTICQLHSPAGQTYQVFTSARNIILSAELGIYPHFPMLKSNNIKKTPKNSIDNSLIVCTFCYHSLIAQWTAYHLSSKPEDRDPSNRHYNCRDFVCYVCAVTTYRQLVRSIAVKDFPFLIDHKRPLGALTINKGESVVTCLNCYQTLTHQWVEHERMKVPLEMRKYNWMAVPQSQISARITSKSINDRPTITPILTATNLSCSPFNQINSHSANNRVIPASSTPVAVESIIPKTIIINTADNGLAVNSNMESVIKSSGNSNGTNLNVIGPTFNPSHSLAPLVAAAMAASPVTIKQESNTFDTCFVSNIAKNSTLTQAVQKNGLNSGNHAEVLRQMTKPLNNNSGVTPHNKTNETKQSLSNSHYDAICVNENNSRSSSINLTTLASVAALAGDNRSAEIDSIENSVKHPELPRAVIDSNSFAIHFNALETDTIKNAHNNIKSFDEQNCQNSGFKYSSSKTNEGIARESRHAQEIEELEKNQKFDQSSSKVNLKVIELRKKRLKFLRKLLDSNTTEIDYLSSSSNQNSNEFNASNTDNFSGSIQRNNRESREDSFIRFIDKVIPTLPLNLKDKKKENFTKTLGLTTLKSKRERELKSFIKNKLYRRLSNASFKLDYVEEFLSSFLLESPIETFRTEAYFSSAKISPDSDFLKQKNNDDSKQSLLDTLGLTSSTINHKIKSELDWLSVLKNRKIRRKRNLVCVGKIYNNLSDQILNEWLKKLVSSKSIESSINSELVLKVREKIPIDFKENEIHSLTIDQQNDHNQNETIDSYSKSVITGNTNIDSEHKTLPLLTSKSVEYNCNIGKIINPTRFAQEFHESVLLETQKQITSKINGATIKNRSDTIKAMIGPGSTGLNAVIYDGHSQLDPKNMILANSNHLKDTNLTKDQILKLENRIKDLDQEYCILNAKKMEILKAIEKNEIEKSFCQTEINRLKCLDK
ncbi:hypothetical protein NH340_JMT04813 [Sarcoptes scabiei]|nr:hypothetical protein NH340_JMT04813 [Sarcoptes scabiei]